MSWGSGTKSARALVGGGVKIGGAHEALVGLLERLVRLLNLGGA